MAELQMDTLGAPRVVTGAEYMDALARLGWNKENMASSLPGITKTASALTSFMDQQYNQALAYQKSQVDMAYGVAQTKHLDTVTDQMRQELPYRIKGLDLANQINQNTLDYNNQTLDSRINAQKLTTQQLQNNVDHQTKKYDLDDEEQRQRNAIAGIGLEDLKSQQGRDQAAVDDLPTALNDVPDPHDLNYEDELTRFYQNHANAATNPKTKDQIQAKLKNNDLVRSTLSSFAEQNNLTKQLQDMKVTGDVPISTDVDRLKQDPDAAHLVTSRGNVTRTNRQITEILSSLPTDLTTLPTDVQTAVSDLKNLQNNATTILSDENGMNQVRSGAKSVLFDTNGNVNPKAAGEIQALQTYIGERAKQGLGKLPTGDVTLVAPHGPLEKEPSKVEIKNVPTELIPEVTQHPEKYFPQTPQERAGLPQNQQAQTNQALGAIMAQNPELRALYSKALKSNKDEDWNAAAAALAELQNKQQTKPPPDKPHGTSAAGSAANPEVQPVSYTTGSAGAMEGRIPSSNRAYIAPRGAADVAGIDTNVWQNVMSEEGPEFDKDGTHNSVFGLWEDAAGQHERNAYQAVRESGSHSLAAYNAVTHAWVNQFLGQSQPWRLTSPGMQEMVIADSQHSGGAAAKAIIDRMGGWNAVNAMNPTEAISLYSELRKPLWPGNNTPLPNGATDRVTRERDWALRNNALLSGQQTASVMPMHESGHPMPRTPREALTLGPGKRFMAPDGTLREVPNNIPQYA